MATYTVYLINNAGEHVYCGEARADSVHGAILRVVGHLASGNYGGYYATLNKLDRVG